MRLVGFDGHRRGVREVLFRFVKCVLELVARNSLGFGWAGQHIEVLAGEREDDLCGKERLFDRGRQIVACQISIRVCVGA